MFHIYFFVLKNDILEMFLRLLIKNGIVFRCFRGYINKDSNYHSWILIYDIQNVETSKLSIKRTVY